MIGILEGILHGKTHHKEYATSLKLARYELMRSDDIMKILQTLKDLKSAQNGKLDIARAALGGEKEKMKKIWAEFIEESSNIN